MKKLSTKKALLFSALAMVLCVSMLVGTTFAWFTDTASTNVNKIQAGNLDVALEMYENGDWVSAEGKTLNFIKAEGHENEDILWEPGCTYELPELRIVNNGNLALKYKVVISGINGDAKLNEAIDWTIGSVAQGTEQKLAAGAMTDAFTISGTMKTTAGNEYQGFSIDSVSITVVATQDTVEYDSNDNQYDVGATLPSFWDGTSTEEITASSEDGKYHITNAAEFAWIMSETNHGETNSWNASATFVLDCDIDFNGRTISGIGSAGDNIAFAFDGNGHTISNFTINALDDAHAYDDDGTPAHLYAGLFQQLNGTVKNLTVRNATIIGDQMVGVISSNGDSATIENCKVYNSVVIGGKKVGAVVGYIDRATVKNCYAENCVVYASDNRENQSGEVIGYTGSNCTTENNTFSNVTVTRGVAPTLVSTAEALKTALTNGGYIILTDDINVNNAWTTASLSNKNLNLNGNGHKITNLNGPLINFYGGNCTVNNLTVASSNVVDNSGNCEGSGIILNQAQWASLYMNNCHVKNSALTVGRDTRTGALVGYWIGGGEIRNCTVDNVDITNNGGSVGGMVGHRQVNDGYEAEAKITNCAVTNCELKTTDDSWRVGAIIGTVSSGATTLTNCTESGNTLTQTGVTDPGHSLYGRTASGGTITIN